jgi:hypothetical protein
MTMETTENSKPFVGQVLCSTWGWDQTNCNFYKVLRVLGKMIEIVEVEHVETAGPHGWMFGTCVPNVANKIGFPMRKKIKAGWRGYAVKIASYASAYPWNGKPVEVSHTN